MPPDATRVTETSSITPSASEPARAARVRASPATTSPPETAATPALGASRARAATRLVLADSGVAAVLPGVRCVGTCLAPGSRVDVTVAVDVPLPLVPGSPTITVTSVESMPVDRYRAGP